MFAINDTAAKSQSALDAFMEGLASPGALVELTQSINKGRGAKGKRSAKAEANLRKAIKLLNAGRDDLTRREFSAAAAKFQKALELDNTIVLGWRMLAFAFVNEGEYLKAFNAYEVVARLEPDDVTLLRDVGKVAYSLGKLDLAESLFTKFLAVQPDDEEVTTSLALLLRDGNRYGDAVDLLRQVISQKPERPGLWNALGSVISESGDVSGAMVFFDEALRLDPHFHTARHNRAYYLTVLNEPEKAIAEMEIAAQGLVDPQDIAAATLGKAMVQLLIGDLVGGFESYEARFDGGAAGTVRFAEFGKRWEVADDLNGKTLLVYGEQGLGDEILFANILNDTFEALGPNGKMILAVEPRLKTLFKRSFPQAEVVSHLDVKQFNKMYTMVNLGERGSEVDLWVPMASLFRRFRTHIDAFPKEAGLLKPDPERVAHWRRVLDERGPGPHVGLLWKGLNRAGSRHRAYSAFDLWEPVLKSAGVQFVNLQYGDATAELEEAKARGLDLWTPPGIDLKAHLDDLAALCAALDVVVGPSTATTNIAAAVGTRVWISAGTGWWTRFGTDHAPCYPSMRVFHASQADHWEDIIQNMVAAFDEEFPLKENGQRHRLHAPA